MAILLKTASARVSSIQIMQVTVQNKGKSVWKSRYDGDVSAHNTSDKSKKMSARNKINAAKKEHHHRTGSGGYLKARPLWEKGENMTCLIKGSNQRR